MRQLRWSRLRRTTFPVCFTTEIITPSVFTLLAAAIAAPEFHLAASSAVLLAALVWYSSEAALAMVAGWPLGRWSLLAWLVRDLVLPWLWVQGWAGGQVEWRSASNSVGEQELAADAAEPLGQG